MRRFLHWYLEEADFVEAYFIFLLGFAALTTFAVVAVRVVEHYA